MTTVILAEAKRRIAEIDQMFEEAEGWGSWMVMAANEREDLVNRINSQYPDEKIEHKWQARCGGERTN